MKLRQISTREVPPTLQVFIIEVILADHLIWFLESLRTAKNLDFNHTILARVQYVLDQGHLNMFHQIADKIPITAKRE